MTSGETAPVASSMFLAIQQVTPLTKLNGVILKSKLGS
uniref:Uncharacterized protein n=1 Tax=Anguilla anguilla TaxID=7936 RepID=A0A0E9WJX7_ANGAN